MMGVLFLATSELPLEDLVAAAQSSTTDDTPAMAAILDRFEGLALSIGRSLTGSWSLQQDATQGARLGLVQAVRAHVIGTPGFPAYARRYMYGAARRTLRAMLIDETPIDPTDYEWAEQPPRDQVESSTVEFADLISSLKPDQRSLVAAHYLQDRSMGQIATSLGITKPAVSQRMATVHRALRPIVEGALAA